MEGTQSDFVLLFTAAIIQFWCLILRSTLKAKGEAHAFYRIDVAEGFRIGSLDSRDWATYYHAYPNDQNGVTIQYWRFYSYNDAANNHGSDWEGFHPILNKKPGTCSNRFLTLYLHL